MAADGGALDEPLGGALLDGDYDLIRYRTQLTGRSKRTIRILGGGTRIEWAIQRESAAGLGEVRVNTTVMPTGSTIAVVASTCGELGTTSYRYTATGTDLVIYHYDPSGSGALVNVYTYRRTCRR